jgi:hypothetical protein
LIPGLCCYSHVKGRQQPPPSPSPGSMTSTDHSAGQPPIFNISSHSSPSAESFPSLSCHCHQLSHRPADRDSSTSTEIARSASLLSSVEHQKAVGLVFRARFTLPAVHSSVVEPLRPSEAHRTSTRLPFGYSLTLYSPPLPNSSGLVHPIARHVTRLGDHPRLANRYSPHPVPTSDATHLCALDPSLGAWPSRKAPSLDPCALPGSRAGGTKPAVLRGRVG